MVKTLPPNAGGKGLIPGQRDKIPHASWPKKKKKKRNINNRSNIVTDSMKSFQMGHVKKKSFKKSLIECQSGITVLSIADTLLLGIQTQK